MNVLVVYDSQFGSTAHIAQAIATRLNTTCNVRLITAADGGTLDVIGIDLLLVGGPTHRHGLSQTMETFLDRVPRGALRGIAAAAFDTRYRGAAWLTGSAASGIARRLTKDGARLVAEPESFFIEKDVPPQGEKRRHEVERLEPGEEERASAWAMNIAAHLAPGASGSSSGKGGT